MKCMDCGREMQAGTTTYFVDLKTCMVIVKNVPCLECEQCGETVFTDAVAERLDEIIKAVKGLMTEIAVVEYTETAA